MGEVKHYDPRLVTLNVLGIPIDSGFADGSFVIIEHLDPDFKAKKGPDGQVSRTKTNSQHCKITIRLMQTSDANARLSALSKIDRTADNGAGVGPFACKDRGGTSLHFASQAWISERPKIEYGDDVLVREWVLEASDLDGLDGGN